MEQIFYNGKIITMTKKDTEEELSSAPEAILIKDGVIIKSGTLDEVQKLANNNAVKRDLEGKCLMPSFIDSHSHFLMTGQMSAWADLSSCESFDDIISSITEYINTNQLSKNDIAIGFGYDHNFLKEGKHPDKRVLDKASNEIPIFILHISAHLGCSNSACLKLAGINENTPDPEGGIIGRIDGSTEPNGYAEEAGISLLQRAIMSRIKINPLQMIQQMQDIYIKHGITTVQDGASTENDINMLLGMSSSGKLKLDVIAYPLIASDGSADLMKKYGEQYNSYINRFKIGGYKLILDGSPQGKSAWLSEPYAGDETRNYCGYPWMNDEKVQDYIKQAIAENKQLLAHCNGDAASEQFISAYEKALTETKGDKNLRPVMIHCQTVRNDQLERMAKLNMIASIFVGHVWYWGDIHMKNLGLQRGNHISPIKDTIDRGVLPTFHQDTPVTKPDMLHSVWCAVNRISKGGNIIGSKQKISVYDALKAVTINPAYQYFEEDTKGSIAKGKKADLVILSASPLEIDPINIKNIKVLETIKDGQTIYQSRC